MSNHIPTDKAPITPDVWARLGDQQVAPGPVFRHYRLGKGGRVVKVADDHQGLPMDREWPFACTG